jgi:GntR family transcriptional regulator, arabinose operon transcriptional repressor
MEKSSPFMYQRVKNTLVDIITSGKFNPGDRLPSERQLAKEMGCNYQTIRRGFAMLEDQKLVERRVGAGTFLLKSGPLKDLSVAVSLGQGTVGKNSGVKVKPYMGVIASSALSEFDRELLQHLHHQAQQRGYRLAIRTVSDFDTAAQEAAQEFTEHGCFAVLMPRFPGSLSPVKVQELITRLSIPVVLSQPIPGLEKYCYEKAEVFGRPTMAVMETACRYFKELGYGQIAFFGANMPEENDLQRMVMAYSCFVAREGMSTHLGLPTEIGPGGPNPEEVDRIVKQWSTMAGNLAVICWGDEYALRLMISLHKQGLRIPEDVAVLGFGDIPLAKTFDPPLSTIRFDYDYVAGAMLDHAEALKQGKSAQAAGNAVEILVVRDSCGGKLRAGEKLPEIIQRVQKIYDPIGKQAP